MGDDFATPPRQAQRHNAISIDPSPLSNISKSRLNYTDAPLTDPPEESETEADPPEPQRPVTKEIRIEPSEKVEMAELRPIKINGKKYRLLHLIGRGGSSKVFKVLAPDNQVLALKRVEFDNLDDVTVSGFVDEIELLKALGNEENIIRLFDSVINQKRKCLYMIMEYGEIDLSQMLKKMTKKTVDYNFIRYCWQQMLQAVKRVHAAKVVHCDLKPANFLMVKGRLKLIDFGISKAMMNDTTNIIRENQVGTVNYMCPEAFQESSSSAKAQFKLGRPADVWSLGCILYEMTFGRPPFDGSSSGNRILKIMNPNYQIQYPPIDNLQLLDAIKGCLNRCAKKRLTIDQLLVHPFLVPHLVPEGLVSISQEQIKALLAEFAQAHPEISPDYLSKQIFDQWLQESRLPRPL